MNRDRQRLDRQQLDGQRLAGQPRRHEALRHRRRARQACASNTRPFAPDLYARYSRLKLERGETNALSIDEALALSRARQSAIVEFVVTETTTYAFLLDGERPGASVQAFALPIARKALTARVNELVQQIANRDVSFRVAAVDLYRVLLGEVTRGCGPTAP